jgi:hypothetical protein
MNERYPITSLDMSNVLIKYEDVMIEEKTQNSLNLKIYTLLTTYNQGLIFKK